MNIVECCVLFIFYKGKKVSIYTTIIADEYGKLLSVKRATFFGKPRLGESTQFGKIMGVSAQQGENIVYIQEEAAFERLMNRLTGKEVKEMEFMKE